MGRVLAETNVARQEELGEQLCELLEGKNHGRVISVGNGTALVLVSAAAVVAATYLLHLHRDTEKNDALQSLLNEGPKEALELVDTPSLLTWERRDDLLGIRVIRNEDGVHEHVLRDISSLVLVLAGERMVVPAVEDGSDVSPCMLRALRDLELRSFEL